MHHRAGSLSGPRTPSVCAQVPRKDTNGNIMDAHDGKLIYVNGTYYLCGTTYRSCGGRPCQFNATFSCIPVGTSSLDTSEQ